jgi:hypothetical protein
MKRKRDELCRVPGSEEVAKLLKSFRLWAAASSYFQRLSDVCFDRAVAALKKAKGIR